MKPPKFEYHNPTTLLQVLDLMHQLGDTARPLAGGQSLVPLMNLRLARPQHLIDLNSVQELRFLRAGNNLLEIGAMTRQRELERSIEILERWPIIAEATSCIGHVQIRNRGTVGGSLAHAFPSAELPLVMVALEASFIVRKENHQRQVASSEFFVNYMTTALEPDELLVAIQVPSLSKHTGWSFQEISLRHGDFALAGVATLLSLNEGLIRDASLILTGRIPIRATEAEEFLRGQKPTESIFQEAARLATVNLEQDSDIHASADYRRRACGVLARRSLQEALARAYPKTKDD
ncbi:MAG: xanthine dehydrogenase family protein subunit M [Deltaproteobacteria bacterium]|nr:xanthine dehydrogenase family protein subunit M [Deltaproteobacteria bacterium]